MSDKVGFIAEISGNGVNGNKINFSQLGPSKESSHQVLGDMQSDKLARFWNKFNTVQGYVDTYDTYLVVSIYPAQFGNMLDERFMDPKNALKIVESIVGRMREMKIIDGKTIRQVVYKGRVAFQARPEEPKNAQENMIRDLERVVYEAEKESQETAKEMSRQLE